MHARYQHTQPLDNLRRIWRGEGEMCALQPGQERARNSLPLLYTEHDGWLSGVGAERALDVHPSFAV